MRASDYGDKGERVWKDPIHHARSCAEFNMVRDRMDAPAQAKSSGERISDDLQSVAKYAEEVAEFLAARTSSIVKHYPEACSEDPGAMKADYIPDYFSNLRASTCRIRAALSAIMDVGQRIDL